MGFYNIEKGSFKGNKSFLFFLLGQGVSNLGDTFQLVALAMLMLQRTGSGLSAGFAIVCAPIPGILLSLFAGGFGDRYNIKYMLIIIDLLRAMVVILFVFSESIFFIYLLILLLSSLNAVYNPALKKIPVNILNKNQLAKGNAYLGGVSGAAYLIGPVLAGIILTYSGVGIGFVINSLSYVYSALMLLNMNCKSSISKYKRSDKYFKGLIEEIKQGAIYFSRNSIIKEMIICGTVLSFGAAAVNLAFYPFAFDILNVTGKGWGIMLSILYGASILAMPPIILAGEKANTYLKSFIFFPALLVAFIWFLYGITGSLALVILLMLFEGITSSLCYTMISSRLQFYSQKDYTARVMGFNDILNNSGKILGIGFSFCLIHVFSYQSVFIGSSLVLGIYMFYKLIHVEK